MKKLFLVLTALLISLNLIAETKMKNEITDSFTDKIKSINEEEKEIIVEFSRHAALYKMQKTNPRFLELKAKLEVLKKEQKKVKIIATMPMMEIKDITE